MDIFLPGPPMVDMLLPTVDMPLPGPPTYGGYAPPNYGYAPARISTVDMLPPAMNTLLSEPTTVDTSFLTEGYA